MQRTELQIAHKYVPTLQFFNGNLKFDGSSPVFDFENFRKKKNKERMKETS